MEMMEKKRIGKDWMDQKERIDRKGDKEGIPGPVFISSFSFYCMENRFLGKGCGEHGLQFKLWGKSIPSGSFWFGWWRWEVVMTNLMMNFVGGTGRWREICFSSSRRERIFFSQTGGAHSTWWFRWDIGWSGSFLCVSFAIILSTSHWMFKIMTWHSVQHVRHITSVFTGQI